jgi:hypothetical protein
MSYVKSSTAADIPPETIELMAGLVGLSVAGEEVAALAGAVRDQLASIGSLDQLDLTGVFPSVEFDPRWEV